MQTGFKNKKRVDSGTSDFKMEFLLLVYLWTSSYEYFFILSTHTDNIRAENVTVGNHRLNFIVDLVLMTRVNLSDLVKHKIVLIFAEVMQFMHISFLLILRKNNHNWTIVLIHIVTILVLTFKKKSGHIYQFEFQIRFPFPVDSMK